MYDIFDPELLSAYKPADNKTKDKVPNDKGPKPEIDLGISKGKKNKPIIKVIGVGGGGSNAVTNMYYEEVKDVEFVICNTDKQALYNSPVPNKIQLGSELTSGLGAGNDPRTGRDAAKESVDEIREILNDGTRMVFITAGMGGGTGTGAAPVIANIARELDILTVAIVTLPFRFEGLKRLQQAIEGIRELQKNVDALLLIDNERIQEVYGEAPAKEAFKKADQVLTIAARGISDIINTEGFINVDFADVKNILKDSGIAIMGTGVAEGEKRAIKAAEEAIHSPLLNFLSINGAKNLLFNISSNDSSGQLVTKEIDDIAKYIAQETGTIPDTIWGYSENPAIEEGKIYVTIIATGFEIDINDYLDKMLEDLKKRLQPLKNEQKTQEKTKNTEPKISFPDRENNQQQEQKNIEKPQKQPEKHKSTIFEDNYKELAKSFKPHPLEIKELKDIDRLEEEPAYIRYGYTTDIKENDEDGSKTIRVIYK